MNDGMAAAIARINRKKSPFTDDQLQRLIAMDRRNTMFYRGRRAVGNALVDCFNEGRPYSHISQKPKEIRS